MNSRWITSGIVATTFLIYTASDLQAQSRRPAGISSLGEMKCENIDEPGLDPGNFKVRYIPMNKDILFGNTVVRAIAYFGKQSWLAGRGGFGRDKPITLVCQLAQSNQTPKYRNLKLYFGFNALDDREPKYREAVLKFSIYKDGEDYPIKYDFLRMGDRLQWDINVTGARYIKLEGECLGYSNGCTGLYFFQDILE